MTGARRGVWVVALALTALGIGPQQARRIDLFGARAVSRVTQAEFRLWHQAGAVLPLDVRSAGAYRAGRIPGAMHVAPGDIAGAAEAIRRRAGGRRIVAYCSCPAEQTSAEAARMLMQQGVTGIGVLVGGFAQWALDGGPVESGGSAIADRQRRGARRKPPAHEQDGQQAE